MSIATVPQDIIDTIVELPVFKAAEAAKHTKKVKARQQLIDRLAAVEVDERRQEKWLKAELAAMIDHLQKAEAAVVDARVAVKVAADAITNNKNAATAQKAAIKAELARILDDKVKAAAQALIRELQLEHPKLRNSPPPLKTEEQKVKLSTGGTRTDIITSIDHPRRSADLQALIAAPNEVDEVIVNTADPAETLVKFDEIRRRLIRETEIAA